MMSKEYATALFSFASEENCREKIAEELTVISDVFEKNGDYIELLSSPAIPKQERINMIEKAFSELHEYTLSFLKLLCDKRVISGILEIIAEYNKLFEQSGKISVANVTSALELTGDEKKTLTQKLEKMCGHTVVINEETDSSILGGMIIEMDGKVIDASLRHQISEVKDVIKK